MKRYSKPLANLLDFKQEFFTSNDTKLAEFKALASVYSSQPLRTACKNCGHNFDAPPSEWFKKLGVDYCLCSECGHCNGLHEDTDYFCQSLYTADGGKNYGRNYTVADVRQYRNRVSEVYLPKARFLVDALAELGQLPSRLTDFGAGAGYFVSAAMRCGFNDVIGYEPSKTLASFGNAMLGTEKLVQHNLSDVITLIESSDAPIASFIGVLEHVQNPREVLDALRRNKSIEYVFFSVPLFSPTVVLESIFDEVMPRHLVAGHTHLYTENSIQHFCNQYGFERKSEWWFGLDMCDLFRSALIALQKSPERTDCLQRYWEDRVMPLIDDLQRVLDRAHACSEVHMLIKKVRC